MMKFSNVWEMVKRSTVNNRKLFLDVVLLGVLATSFGAALMFDSGYLITFSATHPEFAAINVEIVLTRFFGIGRPVFEYLQQLTRHIWVLKLTSNLRKNLYNRLKNDADIFESKYQTGEILALLNQDIEHLQNLYLNVVFPLVISYFIAAVVIVLSGILSVLSALVIFILQLVVLVIIPYFSVKHNARLLIDQQSNLRNQYQHNSDMLYGLFDWKLSNQQTRFTEEMLSGNNRFISREIKIRNYNLIRNVIVTLFFALMVILLIIFATIKFQGSSHTVNYIAAVVLAIFPVFDLYLPVTQSLDEIGLYSDSITNLDKIQASQRKLPEQVKINKFDVKHLDVEDLSFRYPGEKKDILQDINFHLRKGEVLAVLGKSGVGKTSLIEVILGQVTPQKGSVTLNTTNVLQLYTNNFKYFSQLTQSPYLFNTSIMNNVRMGNELASDAEVVDALAKVGLKSYIESLPDKYNTLVGEQGMRFSGGQRQRIALARILLQDNPIVILDEPFVGLDAITENKMLELIFPLFKDKIVIWITHHLAGISHANQVIFIENSKIGLSGEPHELYRTNERFQNLYNLDLY